MVKGSFKLLNPIFLRMWLKRSCSFQSKSCKYCLFVCLFFLQIKSKKLKPKWYVLLFWKVHIHSKYSSDYSPYYFIFKSSFKYMKDSWWVSSRSWREFQSTMSFTALYFCQTGSEMVNPPQVTGQRSEVTSGLDSAPAPATNTTLETGLEPETHKYKSMGADVTIMNTTKYFILIHISQLHNVQQKKKHQQFYTLTMTRLEFFWAILC